MDPKREGRSAMGKFLRVLGSLIGIAGMFLGFVLSLYAIYQIAGRGWMFVGLFTFPITFMLTPLYMLGVYGSWHLLLINYGSMLATWVCYGIADKLEAVQVETSSSEPLPAPKASQTRSDNFVSSAAIWVLVTLAVFGIFSFLTSLPQAARTLHTKIIATENAPPHPTRTPQPISLFACVTDWTIRVRKGPGTNYEIIGGLVSGTCMWISGRNDDLTWAYMTSDDNKEGWVAASLLAINGDLSRAPVISTPGLSDLTPTTRAGE